MTIAVASPLAGWAVPLDQVPDPVFAERMLGDGIAIDPVEGRLAAPGAGTVVSIHAAGHAVTLALDAGPVLLMHIGLDTVGLGGVGFTPRVKDGDHVAAGATLIDFDLDRLARTARSLITPVIITNGEAFALHDAISGQAVAVGEPLFELDATGAIAEAVETAPSVTRTLRLPLAYGLHARPAARIAKLAAAHPGTIEIVGPEGRAASARSAVAMLALALPHGAEVAVRGSDPTGVDAVAELLESGMGELLAFAPLTAEQSPLPATLPGIVAVPGTAIGPAFRLEARTAAIPKTGAGPGPETRALAAAKDKVRVALEAEAAGLGAQADIAAAHLVFLDDPELAEAAAGAIASDASAGIAWRRAIEGQVATLQAAGSRFAERVDDLIDLERRVIAALYGEPELSPAPPGAILVAGELLPSQLMAYAGAGLAGIATASGGATSHVAIIAAGLGLPTLVSLGAAVERIPGGTMLVIDDGRLLIDPDSATIDQLRTGMATRAARRHAAAARAHEHALTRDGTRIEVFANLGSIADARAAAAEGAEGCGLLRTEFLFLDRAAPPDEEEQREAYQAIADALGAAPADRPHARHRCRQARALPADGGRGESGAGPARHPPPARAARSARQPAARLASRENRGAAAHHAADGRRPGRAGRRSRRARRPRAGAGPRRARARHHGRDPRRRAHRHEPRRATPPSSRSAATTSRNTPWRATAPTLEFAAGHDGLHPAVLRLIDATVRGGSDHGRWTGVCGGLAAEAAAVPLLVGLGVTELSVPVAMIAETKALVRTLELAHCRVLAEAALAAPDAATVRALVAPLLEEAA